MGTSEAKRSPGRPARLSRDAIVDAALSLLARAPREPLGVARIAAAVDAVPAALYRHFASLDELLDSILGRVLESIEFEIREGSDWSDQLRDWMTSLRRHLLRHPAVIPLIGRRGRTSPAWLDAGAIQIAILERAGLSGPELARTYLWIIETTMGFVMQEASLPLTDQIEGARVSLSGMSEEGRDRHARVMPELLRLEGDEFFAFVVDRTLDALRVLLDGRRGNAPGSAT